MQKTRKSVRPVAAEDIAKMADQGQDVSRFFQGKGRMVQPIQRVNVDVTAGMLEDNNLFRIPDVDPRFFGIDLAAMPGGIAASWEGAPFVDTLRSLRDEVPDLVLLDWMLPLMSGIEVCRQLRRQAATASGRSSLREWPSA